MVIVSEICSQLRDLQELSSDDRVEIVANPSTGLPDYTSSYLEARRSIGARILSALKDPIERNAFDLAVLLGLRTRFPVSACFNVHAYCNETCVMCPRREHSGEGLDRVMAESLYRRLIDEFAHSGGRILTFNNFSEIFAHPDGMMFLDHALEHRQLELYIVTNGLNMTCDHVDRLLGIGFSGIVYLSCHAFSQETFRRVTGVDGFSRVFENATYLARSHPSPERIIIQYATDFSSDEEIAAAREYWDFLGVRVNMFQSHTFAGNSTHRVEHSRSGTLAGCVGWGHDAGQPFYQVVVQPDGDVTLCCHDLASSVVLGNCAESSIYDVWNSEKFYKVIGQIYLGKPSSDDFICKKCCMAQYVEQ